MIANLVGSEWRSPEVAHSLPIYNPATGEVIGQVPQSGAKEVDTAVRAAVTGGPLIRAEHRDRVAGHIDKGVAEGASLLVDGRGQMSRPASFWAGRSSII